MLVRPTASMYNIITTTEVEDKLEIDADNEGDTWTLDSASIKSWWEQEQEMKARTYCHERVRRLYNI